MTETGRLEKSSLLRNIGKAIRHYRISKGWSQEELAFNCGLHRTYVGAIERGERNITLLSFEKIANTLGLSPSVLLTGPKEEGLNDTQGVSSSR